MKRIHVFILFLSILLILCMIAFFYSMTTRKNLSNINDLLEKEKTTETDSSVIPYYFFQTYHKINKIPKIVYENADKFAPEYQHYILDDNDCETFLSNYFEPNVLETFKQLNSGPHKADLVRYCLLYVFGGVYMDVKTELIKPFSEIFTDKTKIYSVIATTKDHIYQGIIASPPRSPFFYNQIQYIVNNKNPENYHAYCRYFYESITNETGKEIIPGLNTGKSHSFYLFQEECLPDATLCNDGLDQYGLCCFIYDNDKPVIKGRMSSYPWN